MATLQVLCAIVLLATSVQGCSFFDLKCKVEGSIESVGSQLIDKAEQAFEQAMDHVFDQDIVPLLDKVEAAINAGIDKIDKDINETINHVLSSIETIIQDAAQTANALASNLTHDVEVIISKAASAMEQVVDTFYQDASRLLSEINQIVQKGQCIEAGGAKQIQDQIYKLLKSLNPLYRFSACWRDMGYKITMSLEDLTDIQLYNYQKQCTLLNKITPTTPIEGPGGILETYAQGQLYAAEYYCIGETANAPAFEDTMSKEWLWWGVQYNTWKKIGLSSKRRRLHTVEAALGMQRLRDDPCGTPVECYGEAIKALNEAEQKILGTQTGLLSLNHTVIGIQKQVLTTNATIVTLKANISANSLAISKNTDAIAVNKNTSSADITAVTQKLSTLTTYPCNCTTTDQSITSCTIGNTLSQGFHFYAGINAPSPDIYVMPGVTLKPTHHGIRCCELCMGTAAEAAAYAAAHPSSPDQSLHV